ncbi:MAG: nitroreductase family protein [Deltaproteobacteria bacterium]|nr:MAG: nitroreductase family protein [Deltaproteobacteria bacterium]
MADFMEIIKGRRSIRRYEEREIPENVLNEVLEAIRWAPSWANTQCWEAIVVRNSTIKQKLQETLAPGNPATKAMVGAPVVITLCGKLQSSGYEKGQATTKLGDWFMFDIGLATQNLCLAAHALNLGTVIIGSFSHDRAKEILQAPEGYEVVAMIPVGYPAREAKQSHRRQISEFVHYDRF